MKKVKVLIVDDSAVVRQILTEILSSDKKIEVLGTASDPYFAAQKIKKAKPDVITLDIEMPRMDGLTFLAKIMSQHPIPVVVISSLTKKGTKTALKALEYGAVNVITKPDMYSMEFVAESNMKICDSVKAAAKANVKKLVKISEKELDIQPRYNADVILAKKTDKSMIKTTDVVIVIGASTGGTEVIKEILINLPHDAPGIVIVQHMPEVFTRSYAERLNEVSKITIKEAENGDSIIRGKALIAPGNYHLLVKRSGARYFVQKKFGPLVNRHRPAVDVMFRSAARYVGQNAVGIILTGMGNDGSKGMLELKEAGAKTFAQNEESCVVYGMPKEAVKIGAVDKSLNIEEIRNLIVSYR